MRRFTAWFARRKRNAAWQARRLRATGASPRFASATSPYHSGDHRTAPLTAYHFNQFAIVGCSRTPWSSRYGLRRDDQRTSRAALSFISEPLADWCCSSVKGTSAWKLLAEWFVRWPLAWEASSPTTLELAIVYPLLMIWLLAPLAEFGSKRIANN